jgi:hypothetical protein
VTSDNLARIDEFFKHLASWMAAYKSQTFSFFGIESGNSIELCAAHVRLQSLKADLPPLGRAGRFAYGCVEVRRIAPDACSLLKILVNGSRVSLSDGRELVLPKSDMADIFTSPPIVLHPEGLATNRRISVLDIMGGALNREVTQPQADWTLKAAPTTFDNVNELLGTYQIPGPLGDRRKITVSASTAIEILAESKISDGYAEIGVWLPAGLRPALARLNYRVIEAGKVTKREGIRGGRLSWSRRGPVKVGTTRVAVSRGAIVNCIAVYSEQAHHSAWVGDPKEFQNPRLAAFETVDSKFDVLKAYLLPHERKGAAARHFESAVSWLLWAYGLSTAHLGYADLLKEGPDILAVTPSGLGIAVVECTIGILKTDNKLAKVNRRSILVRERLAAAGFPNIRVLPVLITALRRREVEAELDAATDAGVLVLWREGLERALQEVVAVQDGEQAFRRACQILEAAREERDRKRAEAMAGPL